MAFSIQLSFLPDYPNNPHSQLLPHHKVVDILLDFFTYAFSLNVFGGLKTLFSCITDSIAIQTSLFEFR